jgi:hypothetical protein
MDNVGINVVRGSVLMRVRAIFAVFQPEKMGWRISFAEIAFSARTTTGSVGVALGRTASISRGLKQKLFFAFKMDNIFSEGLPRFLED